MQSSMKESRYSPTVSLHIRQCLSDCLVMPGLSQMLIDSGHGHLENTRGGSGATS